MDCLFKAIWSDLLKSAFLVVSLSGSLLLSGALIEAHEGVPPQMGHIDITPQELPEVPEVEGPGDLCNYPNTESTLSQDQQWYQGFIEGYRFSLISRPIDNLPALLDCAYFLKSADVRMRLKGAACLSALKERVGPPQIEFILASSTNAVKQEKDPIVVEALLKSVRHKDMLSFVRQLLGCTRQESLQRVAFDFAALHPDASFLPELIKIASTKTGWVYQRQIVEIAVVFHLSRDDQPRADALRLLNLMGTSRLLRTLVSLYRDPPENGRKSQMFLLAISEFGGPKMIPFFRKMFRNETDAQRRRLIAQAFWAAQIDPQTYRSGNSPSLNMNQAARLRIVRREVERILDPANREFFKAGEPDQVVLGPLMQSSNSLNGQSRVRFWTRVVRAFSTIPESRIYSSADQELVKAMAGIAAQQMITNRKAALEQIEKAISFAAKISWNSGLPRVFEQIHQWLLTLPDGSVSFDRIAGTYHSGNGYESNELIIQKDGTYKHHVEGDVITDFSGKKTYATGKIIPVGAAILMQPGPSLRRYGIDGPDALVPIYWGSAVFLLPPTDEVMIEFANRVNSQYYPDPITKVWMWYYTNNPDNKSLPGRPVLPSSWAHLILDHEIHPELIDMIGLEGLLNMGSEDGIFKGMSLYSIHKDECDIERVDANWTVQEVQPHQAKALSSYNTRIVRKVVPGDQLSSKYIPWISPEERKPKAELISKTECTIPPGAEIPQTPTQVVLTAEIDPTGTVRSVRLLIPSGGILDQAAENCIKLWKFSRICDPENRFYTATVTFAQRPNTNR